MILKCICESKEEFLFNGQPAVKMRFRSTETVGERLITTLSFKMHVKLEQASEYKVGEEREVTI